MRDSDPLYDVDLFGHLFSTDLEGRCWWCGAVADSQEHKYKRSDLKRLHDGGELYWGGDDGGRTVRSLRKSPEVRFQRTMCQRCNNSRSQPFDQAYDVFSQYLFGTMPNLWELDGLNMIEVFGSDWRKPQLDLARYYAKHFGSKMVDDGVSPPNGLIEFMDGADYPEDCGIFLVKTESLHFGYKAMTSDGSDGIGLWISPGSFYASKDRSKITGYQVTTSVGYVGVQFDWTLGSGRVDSFFGHVEPVLNEIVMSDDYRRDLEKLAKGPPGDAKS